MGNVFIKDLSKLGRDISRILIIDNVADNFDLQRDNGLNIKNFLGDENDNELIHLSEDLISKSI
jgi:CTD small phosphatase-like protein 2